jgi:hypothetical protein
LILALADIRIALPEPGPARPTEVVTRKLDKVVKRAVPVDAVLNIIISNRPVKVKAAFADFRPMSEKQQEGFYARRFHR